MQSVIIEIPLQTDRNGAKETSYTMTRNPKFLDVVSSGVKFLYPGECGVGRYYRHA